MSKRSESTSMRLRPWWAFPRFHWHGGMPKCCLKHSMGKDLKCQKDGEAAKTMET